MDNKGKQLAPANTLVDPCSLVYKGQRLFQPAHFLDDGLRLAAERNDPMARMATQGMPPHAPTKCIPVTNSILAMCRDNNALIEVAPSVDDETIYRPEITFENFSEALGPEEIMQVRLSSLPVAPAVLIKAGFKVLFVHFDHAIYHQVSEKEAETDPLAGKLCMALASLHGVANFGLLMPYTGILVVSKAHSSEVRLARVLDNVRNRCETLILQDYEIKLAADSLTARKKMG